MSKIIKFSKILSACLILLAAVLIAYVTRHDGKIEAHVDSLIICRKAYELKSGSLMHDAHISVLFNSNLNQIRKYRSQVVGGWIYWFVMARNSVRRESFLPVEQKYLLNGK